MKLKAGLFCCFVVAFNTCSLVAQNLPVQQLHVFTNTPDGSTPNGGLVASGATLYGTTYFGGTNFSGFGSVFAVNVDGSNYKLLHSFSSTDGSAPRAGLAISGNVLFGTASAATPGYPAYGVVFSMLTNGSNFTLLHIFTNIDGQVPLGAPIVSGGRIYGTAEIGGAKGEGTVYAMDTNGNNFSVLHSFTNVDGQLPQSELALSGGTLYGTTYNGGVSNYGAIFSISTSGSGFTVIHSFTNLSARYPYAGLVVSGGALYGNTSVGSNQVGITLLLDGTVFSVGTDGGNFKVLHYFSQNIDGRGPTKSLILSNNTLYGTVPGGGTIPGSYAGSGAGTLFSIQTDGSLFKLIRVFANGTDGASPQGPLVLTGDALYGACFSGGAGNPIADGDVFGLALDRISGITKNGDRSMTINFAGVPGNTYLDQATTNLSPAAWNSVGTNTAGADGTWQFTDTNAASLPRQFYRSSTP